MYEFQIIASAEIWALALAFRDVLAASYKSFFANSYLAIKPKR